MGGSYPSGPTQRTVPPRWGFIPIRSHTTDRTRPMGGLYPSTKGSATSQVVSGGSTTCSPKGSATSEVVSQRHTTTTSPQRIIRHKMGHPKGNRARGSTPLPPVDHPDNEGQQSTGWVKGAAVDPKSCRAPNKVEDPLFEDGRSLTSH
ncbi:unnamed protein product [Sphenostylis stenocarpa]|uniref:Uncharacterized protein n=1 Tax=Sphenostylis stenocarpa TaxID=92480 RepID=A0AA86SNW2_9FABA|nr:unnamed protein product [Sphenostylis stenocarpa]